MNEGVMNEKLYGKQHLLDKNKNGKIDAEDFKMLRKGKRKMMDEEMDIFDSLTTDSVDMYPHRPHSRRDDFIEMDYDSVMTDYQDSDDDGIPNKMDMDSGYNWPDKEIDNTVVLDQFDDDVEMNAPTKDPKTKPPGTKPSKPKRGWEKIPRPNVDPKPKAMDRVKRSFRRRGMY